MVLLGALFWGASGPGDAQQPIGMVASLSLPASDAAFGAPAPEKNLPCQRREEERAAPSRSIGSMIHDERSDEQAVARRYERLVFEATVSALIAGWPPEPAEVEVAGGDQSQRICGG